MLPKPRIFYRQVLPVVAMIFLFFFMGCVDRIKSNLVAYKTLDEGMTRSNAIIHSLTTQYLRALEEKVLDPFTAEKAKIWLPRANRVIALSNEMVGYVDALKGSLKEEAGLKTNHDGESFKENDKNAVMRVFEKEGKGAELYRRLKKYRADLASSGIDSMMIASVTILSSSSDSLIIGEQAFTDTYFDDIPVVAALAVLSKFQNNIFIAENELIGYCNNNVSNPAFYSSTYGPLVSISSSLVRANDDIEVIAGIGAFSKAAMPLITIAGKEVEINLAGAAISNVKAESTPGKHFIPVKIAYKNEEGRDQLFTRNIEYTIAETKP